MLILTVQVYENGFVVYCDENNGTWASWEDVLVCHFWKSPGGDPPLAVARGWSRHILYPYPNPTFRSTS